MWYGNRLENGLGPAGVPCGFDSRHLRSTPATARQRPPAPAHGPPDVIGPVGALGPGPDGAPLPLGLLVTEEKVQVVVQVHAEASFGGERPPAALDQRHQPDPGHRRGDLGVVPA